MFKHKPSYKEFEFYILFQTFIHHEQHFPRQPQTNTKTTAAQDQIIFHKNYFWNAYANNPPPTQTNAKSSSKKCKKKTGLNNKDKNQSVCLSWCRVASQRCMVCQCHVVYQ